jgi:hypothetical protein
MIGGCSHLTVGARELRGLYPASSWSQRIQGVVASFILEHESRGLELPSHFSICSFLGVQLNFTLLFCNEVIGLAIF